MEEQLISFETAKLAKEKRFDIPTIYGWEISNVEVYKEKAHNWNGRNIILGTDKYYSRPTQSLLQKWLREIHNIKLVVWDRYEEGYYYAINGATDISKQKIVETYEETLEIGLQEALNLIPYGNKD